MNMRRFVSSVGWILMVATSYGCITESQGDRGEDEGKIDAISSELWSLNGQALWSGGIVPVCWEIGLDENGNGNATPARSNPNFTRIMAIARDAVNGGWGRHANITFTGWGDCPSRDTRTFPNTLAIRLEAVGGWSEFGPVSSRATRMILEGSNLVNTNEGAFRALVLHEFGHALGFAHEFDRDDNPTPAGQDCTGGMGPISFNGWTTPWDRDSVMNWSYCGFNGSPPNPGVLSAWDIVGVQKAYGFKPSGSLVGDGNRCVDVPAPPVSSGGDIQLFGCNGGGNQAQRWDRTNNVLFTDWWNWLDHFMFGITNVPSGVNVDYTPYSATNANQKSRFDNMMIKGLGNKCLDVVWGSFNPGVGVWMWDCHGGAAQRWSLSKPAAFGASEVQIQLAPNPYTTASLCLDVPSASYYAGAPLQIYTCNGASNQRFTVTDAGEIKIGGYCVDVRGYSVTSGAIAQLYNCNNLSNQKWHLTGPVKTAGECLDVGATLDTLGTSNAWHRPLFGNACSGVKGQEFDYYFRN